MKKVLKKERRKLRDTTKVRAIIHSIIKGLLLLIYIHLAYFTPLHVTPLDPLISSNQRLLCLPLRLAYVLGVHSVALCVYLLSKVACPSPSLCFYFLYDVSNICFLSYIYSLFLTLSFLVKPTMIRSNF